MASEETKIAVLQAQMDNIEDKVDELKIIMTDFIGKAEGRFAAKWVENGLKWAITLVLGAVLTALVALVIKA